MHDIAQRIANRHMQRVNTGVTWNPIPIGRRAGLPKEFLAVFSGAKLEGQLADATADRRVPSHLRIRGLRCRPVGGQGSELELGVEGSPRGASVEQQARRENREQ